MNCENCNHSTGIQLEESAYASSNGATHSSITTVSTFFQSVSLFLFLCFCLLCTSSSLYRVAQFACDLIGFLPIFLLILLIKSSICKSLFTFLRLIWSALYFTFWLILCRAKRGTLYFTGLPEAPPKHAADEVTILYELERFRMHKPVVLI